MEALIDDLSSMLDRISMSAHVNGVPTSQVTVDTELLLLQKVEESLLQALHRVVHRRSQLLPALTKKKMTIHCLPPELLIQVFIHATVVEKRTGQTWYMDPDLEWGPVALSHVCQKWRTLALDTSVLWSNVSSRNISALLTYLRRANQQDLDVIWKNVICSSTLAYGRFSMLTRNGVCDRVRSVIWVDQATNLDMLFTHGSFCNLRELVLHRESSTHNGQTADITISMLSAFLQRLPGLEEFTLHGYIPVMDVDANKTAVSLPRLRIFTWKRAQAKTLWRLFVVLGMSRLQSLHLSTKPVPATSWAALATGSVPAVVRFPTLRRLSLSCEDFAAFKLACRKMEFPQLEMLVLSRSSAKEFPVLPSPQQMFREPRLFKLSHLKFNNIELQSEAATSFLDHSPSLKQLSFNACRGASSLMCPLSGHVCCGSRENSYNRWLCPVLDAISISNSSTAKFRCLAAITRERKAHSDPRPGSNGRTAESSNKTTSTASARATIPMTPTKLKRAFTSVTSSPNGSFIDGWRAHEVVRPCRIRAVQIENCKRISQVELLSLQEESYGVEKVSWVP